MENLIKFLEDKITDKMSVEEIVDVFEQMCSTPLEEDMVGGFELFRDTFLFGVFFYQPRKEGLCFFLYIGEVGM